MFTESTHCVHSCTIHLDRAGAVNSFISSHLASRDNELSFGFSNNNMQKITTMHHFCKIKNYTYATKLAPKFMIWDFDWPGRNQTYKPYLHIPLANRPFFRPIKLFGLNHSIVWWLERRHLCNTAQCTVDNAVHIIVALCVPGSPNIQILASSWILLTQFSNLSVWMRDNTSHR